MQLSPHEREKQDAGQAGPTARFQRTQPALLTPHRSHRCPCQHGEPPGATRTQRPTNVTRLWATSPG